MQREFNSCVTLKLLVSDLCAQEQQDHLNEVSTRLNKTATKLELSQSQLDKAAREIKALKEAAEVRER